jgi:endoglucanase
MRSISGLCAVVGMVWLVAGCGGSSDMGGMNDSGARETGGPLGSDSSSESEAGPPLKSDGSAGHDSGQDGSAAQDGAAKGDGGASLGVHAVGDQIYDGTKLIRLLGVDETGSQYACIQGDGFFDPTSPAMGGANTQNSITAMLAWGVNAVRVPLNEDCWLSKNVTATNMAYMGAPYQAAIQTYVNLLLTNNIYPILDLHWTEGAGGSAATGQQPMPDATYGGQFWTSVATMFASENKVIFDLFNEPFPDNNMDSTSAWQCWAQGGDTCPGVSFDVIGMQGMLAAVRAVPGATNLVLMGGIEYSNDLTEWLANAPTDPANNIAASWHVYSDNPYTTAADATPLLAKVPIVATEIGDVTNPPTCTGAFITSVMDVLDNPGAGFAPQSYLAWSWSTDNTPALLSSYEPVTPSCDGPTFMTHLMMQTQ